MVNVLILKRGELILNKYRFALIEAVKLYSAREGHNVMLLLLVQHDHPTFFS
jgi:hypothetical protein